MRVCNERLWHGATSLSNEHNAESVNLAKPHRAGLQGIISVVVNFAKGRCIMLQASILKIHA